MPLVIRCSQLPTADRANRQIDPTTLDCRKHTAEEVLVDELAVGLRDKPVTAGLAQKLPEQDDAVKKPDNKGRKRTLSRVPGVLRGIALTTRDRSNLVEW